MLYLSKEAQITGESFQGSGGTSIPTQIQFAAMGRTVAKAQVDQALIGISAGEARVLITQPFLDAGKSYVSVQLKRPFMQRQEQRQMA
jgi:hypothetical protein